MTTQDPLVALQAERDALAEKMERAVARDQRGDDRCWLDDIELYAVLTDAPVHPNILTLPPREEFLGNCARFFECRQRHEDPLEAEKEYKGQP